MNTSQTQFDFSSRPGLARSSDPATSHDAAKSINAGSVEWIVLQHLETPKTCDELVTDCGENWNTVSPRLAPLRRNGFIEAIGKRPGSSGRSQTVWQLTELGRKVL